MNTTRWGLISVLVWLGIIGPILSTSAKDLWVSGYYPGWDQEKLPPEKLQMDAITNLFHFAATIRPDGSLNLDSHQLSESHIRATVRAAHQAGKKISIVLGGADSGKGFQSASSDPNREHFIAEIVKFVSENNYDGVDIDWEPLAKSENRQFKTFVIELHAALKKRNPDMLLTAATCPDPFNNPEMGKVFGELQDNFDQINLMTYVLSGAWEGWISWHGSPLYNGGLKFSGGRELPSIEIIMANFVESGVKLEKLGIGIPFHGDVWRGGTGTSTGGVTGPKQSWTNPPTVKNDVYYSEIMQNFYAKDGLRYDEAAQNPYITVDLPGAENDVFVSFCDPAAITARLRFMKEKGYGGCIIWHLGQDIMASGEQPLTKALALFRKENAADDK